MIKRKELQWWDVLALSVILFGFPIWNSTRIIFHASAGAAGGGTSFSANDNWFGILTTVIELGLGYLYLRLRKFDFSQWRYKITWKGTAGAVAIFMLMSLSMDVVSILSEGWRAATAYAGYPGILRAISEIDVSLIAFSLLNGAYEEIFFLGVCTMVPDRQKTPVLIYSLLIRFLFHTYQGFASALGIGVLVGALYYVLYRKSNRNLHPFMLSHSLADIFGASLIYLL